MPTKLDLPASDRRFKVQLDASEKRAKELPADFKCCTFPDGTACTGAGKIVTEEGTKRIICGNNCRVIGGRQKAALMTAEEAAACASAESKRTKKRHHHKTPYG